MTAEEVQTSEVRRGNKKHVLLASWASVATALFIATLVFGAIYATSYRPECEGDSDSRDTVEVHVHMKDGDKVEEETIQENRHKHTDFIIKKTKDGDIQLLVGVNYNTKISASYSPREDICVLTAGEDMDWFDDMPDKMNTTVDVKEAEKKADVYIINTDKRVTDLTLLTSEMQIFCRGKVMYWADKSTQEEMKTALATLRGSTLDCQADYRF